MDEFIQYAESNSDLINKKIAEVLSEMKQYINNNAEALIPYFEEFVKANEGGKRIRANLAVLAYQLFGGQNKEDMIDIAAALEIWQTGVLAQDDIIDESDQRRGRPSLHCALGGNHIAEAQAMCLGDLGLGHIPYSIILKSNFDLDKKMAALQCFNDTYNGNTILGQMLDIHLSDIAMPDAELEDVQQMYRLKTANYTVIGPVKIGAILAGATEEQLQLIEEFGELTGVMFQLQDDISGVFGDEKVIGKPVTSDVMEGKKTRLSLLAFQGATPEQLESLKAIYGAKNRNISSEDMAAVRVIFMQTGALQAVKEMMTSYGNQARKIINCFPQNEFRDILEGFIEYIMSKA